MFIYLIARHNLDNANVRNIKIWVDRVKKSRELLFCPQYSLAYSDDLELYRNKCLEIISNSDLIVRMFDYYHDNFSLLENDLAFRLNKPMVIQPSTLEREIKRLRLEEKNSIIDV